MPTKAPLKADANAGHPLVDTAEALTPQWVNAVLHAHGLASNTLVSEVAIEPVGNGMLGSNLRLTLAYDGAADDAPATLVAKLPSESAESRASGAALNLYGRETRFYQELAPRIGQVLPQTLFADVSDDGASFCLLFEDLAPARGGDQLSGCDVADAKAALSAAAAMHAPLWGDAAVLNLDWVDRAPMTGLYIERLPPYVPTAAERFERWLEPGVIDIAARFGDCIERYFTQHHQPWTISHQDFRLDNLLFDARGGALPVAVLDWQTFLPGPGALDAVYFVGAGLLPDDRRAHEQALFRHYHAELLRHGVSDYRETEAWRDYRLHAAHGLIMAIVGAAITTPTERGDQMLSTMINRHALQMMDLGTLDLIEGKETS